jgi:hypothetical protein
VLVKSKIVGVDDVVGDEDDDVGNEGMVDEDVEGGETGGNWCVDQLGTPRVRCDKHNGKFSLSYETKI